MDFRPYVVATIYLIGMVVLIALNQDVGWIILFTLVGGAFSLLFGFIHRIDLATKQSTKESLLFNPPSIDDPHTQEEIRVHRETKGI